jgi:hypothetical protein
LTLDAAGRPHFCYGDASFSQGWLRYASYDGTVWHIDTVDGSGNLGAGGDCSLALDAADQPHISYYDWEHGDLRYAYYDGAAWWVETVDSAGTVGSNTSLALDAAGQPHISYKDGTRDDLKYARACRPLAGAALAGPALLPLGIAGHYSATHTPLTATIPVRFSWDNGTVGSTATYTWTSAGSQSLAVTITNPCSTARADFTVTVFCQPLTGAQVAGPFSLLAGQEGTYRVIPQPITASRPLTSTWDNGVVGPTTGYSWTVTGTYTLTVTATNVCGGIRQATFTVRVLAAWPHHLYLPLYQRHL